MQDTYKVGIDYVCMFHFLNFVQKCKFLGNASAVHRLEKINYALWFRAFYNYWPINFIFIGYYKLKVEPENTTVTSYNDSYCAVTFAINILKVAIHLFCQPYTCSSDFPFVTVSVQLDNTLS